MSFSIAYGKGHLSIELPADRTTVIEPSHRDGLGDEKGAFLSALDMPTGTRPLREWWKRGRGVCVVFTDITRATPNDRIIPWLLEEL